MLIPHQVFLKLHSLSSFSSCLAQLGLANSASCKKIESDLTMRNDKNPVSRVGLGPVQMSKTAKREADRCNLPSNTSNESSKLLWNWLIADMVAQLINQNDDRSPRSISLKAHQPLLPWASVFIWAVIIPLSCLHFMTSTFFFFLCFFALTSASSD